MSANELLAAFESHIDYELEEVEFTVMFRSLSNEEEKVEAETLLRAINTLPVLKETYK